MHKPRIYVISSVFHRFISHMSEFVFDVFGIIEIKRNRFSRLVMHVSGIVEERRNVVRWRNTPAGPRNQRRGSQGMIFLQIWIFLENLYLRQTIYHYQCLGQAYAYAYAYCILHMHMHMQIAARVGITVIPTLASILHTFYKLFAFSVPAL